MRRFLVTLLLVTTAVAPATAGVSTTSTSGTVSDLGGGDYSFTISGWSGGGTLSGTFSGAPLDGSNQITSFNGSLTAFTGLWSGDSETTGFSFGLTDLFGFVWTVGNFSAFGTDTSGFIEGIGAGGDFYAVSFGPGPVSPCDGEVVCGAVETADVPGPAPLALFGLGLLGVAAAKARRAKG